MAISDLIRMHHDGILEGWLALATRARSAAGLEREEILGGMPGYLAVLEDPAMNPGESDGSRQRQVEAHLAIRIRQGFLLDEIVREYEALRAVIEAIVRATAPENVAAALALLRGEVDRVIVSTSALFHDRMAGGGQAEKGYSHRLERLARGILEHGASRFDELDLDNVKLVSELAEKVDALRAERELREQFVSSVAHDLRGPLSVVKLGTQTLLRSLERPDRYLDLVSRIARNIDRADGMIQDLLDVSRIHAGEPLPITLAECEATSMARELLDELNALYGERFVLRAEGIVPGYWSAHELRRALWNLATNAAKYGTADRPITVTVTSRGSAVSISVHNHGTPIPPAEQERIFEPFFRLQRGRTGPHGWGLGLTLVRGCAAAHGGRVEVHSDAASGTTFTLELPLDLRANPP